MIRWFFSGDCHTFHWKFAMNFLFSVFCTWEFFIDNISQLFAFRKIIRRQFAIFWFVFVYFFLYQSVNNFLIRNRQLFTKNARNNLLPRKRQIITLSTHWDYQQITEQLMILNYLSQWSQFSVLKSQYQPDTNTEFNKIYLQRKKEDIKLRLWLAYSSFAVNPARILITSWTFPGHQKQSHSSL